MAIRIDDSFEAVTQTVGGNNAQARVRYIVFDVPAASSDPEADVRTIADSDLPTSYNGLPRQSYDITERINDTTFRVEALFEPTERQATDAPARAFDTTGQTVKINQAIDTTPYPGTAPDEEGAIGFDGESVQGVDIIEASFGLNETHFYSSSTVDEAFMQNIHQLTGKVNNAAFRGWAAGEVLFTGVIANRRPDTVWEINYQFSARRNQTGLSVGTITGIDKKGWEYLDVRYAKSVDTGVRVQKPSAVYVHQVYELGDFSLLGLGSW